MKNYVKEIQTKTAGMSKGDKISYIITYYWYHILGLLAGIGLVVFLIIHSIAVLTGAEHADFTCILVNQKIDDQRDNEIRQSFAASAGIDEKKIVVDSDYNISYGETKLEGVNESSYEKFFFKWRNEELDAVILQESFYEYIKELGGAYRDLDEFETGDLELYEDQGVHTAVLIEKTRIDDYLINETGEQLFLVFPQNGQHPSLCQAFLNYINGETEENV
ncbi:MAG: hypothetical protein Q4C91_18615 [Eubacteriales bacterium]|nr:hypothetical protein [Eubacteriales bacterium]